MLCMHIFARLDHHNARMLLGLKKTLHQDKRLSSFTLESYLCIYKIGFGFSNPLWLPRYLKKCPK